MKGYSGKKKGKAGNRPTLPNWNTPKILGCLIQAQVPFYKVKHCAYRKPAANAKMYAGEFSLNLK